MEERDTRSGWGGKRPGAGRPKGSVKGNLRKYKSVSLALLEEDYEAMKKLADASGKSFSRFVADRILGRE